MKTTEEPMKTTETPMKTSEGMANFKCLDSSEGMAQTLPLISIVAGCHVLALRAK